MPNYVKSVPVPNDSGYPNGIKNTQTVKTRGTGAATKGTMHCVGGGVMPKGIVIGNNHVGDKAT